MALFTGVGEPSVVWRWFDAVVLGSAESVHLWEPLHGEITARPREPDVVPRTGSRAYVSAGLPGADWWLSGSAVGAPNEARVELADVRRFYLDHGLWDAL